MHKSLKLEHFEPLHAQNPWNLPHFEPLHKQTPWISPQKILGTLLVISGISFDFQSTSFTTLHSTRTGDPDQARPSLAGSSGLPGSSGSPGSSGFSDTTNLQNWRTSCYQQRSQIVILKQTCTGGLAKKAANLYILPRSAKGLFH